MADPRFFEKADTFTLGQLVDLSKAEVSAGADLGLTLVDTAPLDRAEAGHVTCFHNTKYTDQLKATKASVVIIHPDHADKAPASAVLLLTKQPYRVFGKIAVAFYPTVQPYKGVCSSAYVDPSASLGEDVSIGPFAVISANVTIGARTRIGPHCVIEAGVAIGEDCSFDSHISMSHSIVGNRVHIKPGARIGQSGFGFHMDEHGHFPIPQLGRVLVGDDVEIGANTTIDRGAEPDTIIGRGSRIDNLVQLGHNVQLGDNCVIVAQVGISGSTKLGKFVIAAGQVGVAGHLSIGDGAKIAAKSGVMRNIKPGETVGGCPAMPVKDWHRQTVAISKLTKGQTND
jgi:UDP-3-O-[3-hydroxymyristoyl] glucosamine N-acyltransferase